MLGTSLALALAAGEPQEEPVTLDPLDPVSFTNVRIADPFFAPRLDVNRRVTLAANLAKCEETGRIRNFAVAGGRRGSPSCSTSRSASPT